MPITMTAPTGTFGGRIVTAPVAKSIQNRGGGRPRLTTTRKGLVITHSEMIGTLFSSGTTLTYNAVGFDVNPGRFATFPWASTIASNFDKYRCIKLQFRLISNQPTSVAGRIGVGFDYDSTDTLPADRVEFFSLTHHAECAPWDSIALNVPVDSAYRFVNSHTATDLKLIDVGQVIIMADQIVATHTSLADLIVDYSFELIEPQQAIYSTMLHSGANPAAFTDMTLVGPIVAGVSTTTSTTVYFYNLPQGYYDVSYVTRDAAAGTPTVALAITNGQGTGSQSNTGSTTDNNTNALVKVTGPSCQLRVTLGTVAIANLELILAKITRISAAVYNGRAYATALATF
jgi:hypothetical protein